jgi:hypothetical protein
MVAVVVSKETWAAWLLAVVMMMMMMMISKLRSHYS